MASRPANAIQKQVPEFFHLNPPTIEKYDNWIALVRDPVERIQSSWIYEHPDNAQFRVDRVGKFLHNFRPKFYECYPTLDPALKTGLTAPSTQENDSPMLAKKVFLGHVGQEFYGMAHFKFNFEFYYKELLEQAAKKRIFVVRSERMLADLNTVHKMLGGQGDVFTQTKHHAHFKGMGKEGLPMTDRTISPEGMQNLCHFLCTEIQMYKQLLKQAVNFPPEHKLVPPSGLVEKCPIEAASDFCPQKPYRADE